MNQEQEIAALKARVAALEGKQPQQAAPKTKVYEVGKRSRTAWDGDQHLFDHAPDFIELFRVGNMQLVGSYDPDPDVERGLGKGYKRYKLAREQSLFVSSRLGAGLSYDDILAEIKTMRAATC
jgi:hypothetical protein